MDQMELVKDCTSNRVSYVTVNEEEEISYTLHCREVASQSLVYGDVERERSRSP